MTLTDLYDLVLRSKEYAREAEQSETGAFTRDDHLAASRAAGLEVEHDPVGLIGRGLYIAVRRANSTIGGTTEL